MEQTKICTKCKKELPATREYFFKQKLGKYGVRAVCKACIKIYKKDYYNNNIEKIKAYDKKYIVLNKEKRNKNSREHSRANRQRYSELHKIWAENNKEHLRQYFKKYYQTGRGRQTVILYVRKRYSLKKNLPNELTLEQWNYCLEYFDNKCAYCGNSNEKLSMEHFIPVTQNGELAITNILPACKKCNCSKNNKNFFEWYPKQSFYNKLREKKILKYLNYTKDKFQILELIG